MQKTVGIVVFDLHKDLEKITYSCSPGIILTIFH